VADALHSASIHLLRRIREVDRETGVSPARLSVLSVLVFGGPRPLGRLAQIEQVRQPTMSRLVQGLERAGLARREANPLDGRGVLVRATQRGKRLLERGRRRRLDRLEELLSGLGGRDLGSVSRAAAILGRLASTRA
jgi:DNA-binding MarR family transcriptional regulator